jgi:hypothetical protein
MGMSRRKWWKIGKLRPLTILMGLYAEAWAEKIRQRHQTSLPEDWACHPSRVIEHAYTHCLMAKNGPGPWVVITHQIDAIYAWNNCIYAFPLGKAEIPGVADPALRLDPRSVIAYQCDSETEEPVCVSDPKTGWISEEALGKYSDRLMADLNRIGTALYHLEDKRVKDTSQKARRVRDTIAKAPRLDPDTVTARLGAKKMGRSPKRSTAAIPTQPPRRRP